MRRLSLRDLGKASALVKRLDIKQKIIGLAKQIQSGGVNVETFGFEMIFMVVESAADDASMRMLADFLSGPLELSPDEVLDHSVLEIAQMATSPEVASIEEWRSFFDSVTKRMS